MTLRRRLRSESVTGALLLSPPSSAAQLLAVSTESSVGVEPESDWTYLLTTDDQLNQSIRKEFYYDHVCVVLLELEQRRCPRFLVVVSSCRETTSSGRSWSWGALRPPLGGLGLGSRGAPRPPPLCGLGQPPPLGGLSLGSRGALWAALVSVLAVTVLVLILVKQKWSWLHRWNLLVNTSAAYCYRWSNVVCLCICVSRQWVLQKWMNQSSCCLSVDSWVPKVL